MLNITKGVQPRAQRIVLYGVEGIGKTTFASKFPDPLFLDTEGGTTHLDVARVAGIATFSELMADIKEIGRIKPCKTLVLDTIDWAESLAIKEILAEHKEAKSLEDFGYGRGYGLLEQKIGELLNALGDACDNGLNVLVLAHAVTRKFELPDEAAAYDKWELKLQKRVAPKVREWADALLFANYKTIVEVVQNGMNKSGKARGAARKLFTEHDATFDAKNRWGLTGVMPFEYETVKPYIYLGADTSAPTPAPAAPAKSAPIAKDDTAVKALDETLERMEQEVATAKQRFNVPADAPTPTAPDTPQNWQPLKPFLERDNITIEQVQKFVAAQGHYTADTPLENYADNYITGMLIPQWDKVAAYIKKKF